MNSRVSWFAALSVGFGVAIAIKSCGPGDADRTATDGPSSPAIPAHVRHDVAPSRDENFRDNEQQAQEDVAQPAAPSTTPVAHAVTVQSLGILPDLNLIQAARKFESESKDPTWSDAADAHILGKLSRMTYLKAVYVEADCRTTMCRIQIAPIHFPPPSWELGEVVYKLGLSPWQLQGDRLTMLTYLERDRLIWVEPPNATVAQ